MHLAVIKDDLTQFIHTHPENGAADHHGFQFIPEVSAHGGESLGAIEDTILFHVSFPEAGLYKVFAQFRPEGTNLPLDEALTASFWIQVEGQGEGMPEGHRESTLLKPPLSSEWWLLLVVSLFLIGLLSFAVRKFIQVPKEK